MFNLFNSTPKNITEEDIYSTINGDNYMKVGVYNDYILNKMNEFKKEVQTGYELCPYYVFFYNKKNISYREQWKPKAFGELIFNALRNGIYEIIKINNPTKIHKLYKEKEGFYIRGPYYNTGYGSYETVEYLIKKWILIFEDKKKGGTRRRRLRRRLSKRGSQKKMPKCSRKK
jgi:hypothetical protein